MAFAGQLLTAGRIPGERIATAIETSDGSNFGGTETVVMTLSDVPVVAGRTYQARGVLSFQGTSDDLGRASLRFDDTSGDPIQVTHFDLPGAGGPGYPTILEGEFTASSTGTVTIVATGQRINGSNDMNLDAASGRPSYLYVDYSRG